MMRDAGGTLRLEVRGLRGLPMVLETSEDLSSWNEVQKVSGQGEDSPVKVTVQPEPQVQGKFWRMRII
jgi:hypothetical protein